MSVISERASRLSKDFVRALREVVPVRQEGHALVQKAGKSLDELVLSKATTRNIVTYHPSPEASFQAVMDALQGAKKSFHVETFIWHDDESGRKLADALVKKVQNAKAAGGHFDAKVLVDSIGVKSGFGTNDKGLIKYLSDNGVDARLFNPNYVSLSAKGHIPLTHRKLYIADGEKYVTGGRNIGDEYFRPQFMTKWGDATSKQTSYHDFLMTVQGEEAAKVQGEFYKNWASVGGEVPRELPKAVPAAGKTKIGTFVTDPVAHKFEIKDAHLKAVANAKRDILVISPYFADDDFVDALISAKKKNVALRERLMGQATNKYEREAVDKAVPELKVRALIPFSGEKGKDLNYEAGLMTAKQLLDGGVEVRLTKGGMGDLGTEAFGKPVSRFSHFKGLQVDGELLSIGSANADYRTYHTNHELVNIIGDKQKIAEFDRAVATPDWENAMPIDQEWIRKNSTWKEKLLRTVLEPLDFLY